MQTSGNASEYAGCLLRTTWACDRESQMDCIAPKTFPACRAHYPGGPNRCLSVSSLFARPSPVNGRVGIHNFTFGACSSFTRVTACKVACPPKGGLLSRGFDPVSYPTVPLGSYHVLPTTT